MSTKYPQGLINGTPPYTTGNFSGVWTLEQLAQNYYYYGSNVSNSLRFRSSASAYLNRTPSVAGNQKTWTWSGWVKRGILGTGNARLLWGGNSSTDGFAFTFVSGDQLYVWNYAASTTTLALTTSAVFRDSSAWYHIVLAVDTTQATDVNRVKLYINGVQYTFGTTTWCAQNTSLLFNAANQNTIGTSPPYGGYFDGYMAEVNFIDGQALTPSSFGVIAPATGVWSPKRYSGTYGVNGFYLPFSNGTSTTTLGYDSSGNGNNWTTNNISLTAGSTYDWMLDSPTAYQGSSYGVGNYAVLNPISNPNVPIYTISNGNLSYSCSASVGNARQMSALSSIGVSSNKWYCEATETSSNSGFGVSSGLVAGGTANGVEYAAAFNGGAGSSSATYSGTTPTFTANDVIGLAFDASALTLAIYKNGTLLGSFSGLESSVKQWFFIQTVSTGAANTSSVWNFGQRPFAYTPPSGYKSLCAWNLPNPTIQNGASYMAATTYNGNGSTQSITNTVNGVSFQPDFVWAKIRNTAGSHNLVDSVRGNTKYLYSDRTDAEGTYSDKLTSFNSNGFSLGADSTGVGQINTNGNSFVGWQWKANGTAVSNTAGSITSQVSANTTSGFAVVTYTGTGANATVGHGLGVAPSMVIVKNRTTAATSWIVYHSALSTPATQALYLNTTDAVMTSSLYWNSTAPTASVFSVAAYNPTNQSTGAIVAYCFAAIAGYSAFGSYTGNGSTDGPFVYCGFRPRFILVKATAGTSAAAANWLILDTSRSPSNVADYKLAPNLSEAENGTSIGGTGSNSYDLLSNGFKARTTNGSSNESGTTYIYAAFAENPFKYSLAR